MQLPKEVCASVQEKESIIVVRCGLKILSLRITVWYHLASLVMPNSYPHDGIFNPHLTTIKDSYTSDPLLQHWRNIYDLDLWHGLYHGKYDTALCGGIFFNKSLKFYVVELVFYSPSIHFKSFRGRSVNLDALFLGKLGSLPVLSVHSFASNWQVPFLNQRKGENGSRNISWPNLNERMFCRM